MAGDWIKWTKGLSKRREVLAISKILNMNRREVSTLCMECWEWGDENTIDGHAPSVTQTALDEQTGVLGMGDAMLQVGWLALEKGGITFPNWGRHNSQSAKARALASDRKAKERVTKKSRSQRDKSVTRAENRDSSAAAENIPPTPLVKCEAVESGGALTAFPESHAAVPAVNGKAVGLATLTAALLGRGYTASAFNAASKEYQVVMVLDVAGCDQSFRDAVRSRTKLDPAVHGIVIDVIRKLVVMPQKPDNPGGWVRRALEAKGIEL